jgi:hypothetical protein
MKRISKFAVPAVGRSLPFSDVTPYAKALVV